MCPNARVLPWHQAGHIFPWTRCSYHICVDSTNVQVGAWPARGIARRVLPPALWPGGLCSYHGSLAFPPTLCQVGPIIITPTHDIAITQHPY